MTTMEDALAAPDDSILAGIKLYPLGAAQWAELLRWAKSTLLRETNETIEEIGMPDEDAKQMRSATIDEARSLSVYAEPFQAMLLRPDCVGRFLLLSAQIGNPDLCEADIEQAAPTMNAQAVAAAKVMELSAAAETAAQKPGAEKKARRPKPKRK